MSRPLEEEPAADFQSPADPVAGRPALQLFSCNPGQYLAVLGFVPFHEAAQDFFPDPLNSYQFLYCLVFSEQGRVGLQQFPSQFHSFLLQGHRRKADGSDRSVLSPEQRLRVDAGQPRDAFEDLQVGSSFPVFELHVVGVGDAEMCGNLLPRQVVLLAPGFQQSVIEGHRKPPMHKAVSAGSAQ